MRRRTMFLCTVPDAPDPLSDQPEDHTGHEGWSLSGQYSRGGLIDTQALIEALAAKKFGGVGLDVYEEEEGLFYEDCSAEIIQDENLAGW